MTAAAWAPPRKLRVQRALQAVFGDRPVTYEKSSRRAPATRSVKERQLAIMYRAKASGGQVV